MPLQFVARGPLQIPTGGDPITDGLIAYWPMNENTGTTLNDIVGGYDATVTGAGFSWIGGKPAFTNLDFATAIHSPQLDFNGALTVFGWINAPAQSTNTYTFTIYDFNNLRSISIGAKATTDFNTLKVFLSPDGQPLGGSGKSYVGSQICFDSTTNSIAIRFNAGVLDLFVDATIDTSVSKDIDNAMTDIFSTSTPIAFSGVHNVGVPGPGTEVGTIIMSKWRLYNTAKSNSDIAAIHALGP